MNKCFILILSILVFVFSSCKKELEINVEKTYVEEGKAASNLGFGGIILTLMPDGKADFLNSGDIVSRGTYSIEGNKVNLTVDEVKYKFKIISGTELRYNSRTLKLATE